MEKVQIKRSSWELAGNLYLPHGFDKSKKYPSVIVGHPIGGCKEQTAGTYAKKLAEAGYISLVFDASTQGESGGEPRFTEDPYMRIEDFRWAVDYLVTLDYIDETRIGLVGICGAGGYAANLAMTERRIKALATITGANYGRVLREGDMTAEAAIRALEALGRQRTAEARGAEAALAGIIPNSQEERQKAGLNDIDYAQAVDYYRTPRAGNPHSPNKMRTVSTETVYGFDAYHLAEYLLTQPLQIIIGSLPGALGAYRDGFELFDKAASKHKNLYIVENAGHVDLYDRPEPVAEAVKKLTEFFGKYL